MVTQVGGLGEFVPEQHDIRRQWATGAQPDPCLGDRRIGVEPAVLEGAVVVDDGMFLTEQVLLDLVDVGAGEGRAVGMRVIGENLGDVVDVAIVPAEMVVGVLGPFEGREVVAGANCTTGMRELGIAIVGGGFIGIGGVWSAVTAVVGRGIRWSPWCVRVGSHRRVGMGARRGVVRSRWRVQW
ncbi:hypothetical protein [Nocardia suismassiliense]|uniref:hypothetical protein n=1 Tax=Nocardia suismassiliense TaxID=2077092 RepID=UPI00131F1A8F|nr:hypothetical protein [Nocardia suismassiliense]